MKSIFIDFMIKESKCLEIGLLIKQTQAASCIEISLIQQACQQQAKSLSMSGHFQMSTHTTDDQCFIWKMKQMTTGELACGWELRETRALITLLKFLECLLMSSN